MPLPRPSQGVIVVSASELGCGLADVVEVVTVTVDVAEAAMEVELVTELDIEGGTARDQVDDAWTELDGPPPCAHLAGHWTSVKVNVSFAQVPPVRANSGVAERESSAL